MFDKQDVTIHETANETGAEREMNYLWSKSASANSITHLPLLTMGWYSLEMVFFESVGEQEPCNYAHLSIEIFILFANFTRAILKNEAATIFISGHGCNGSSRTSTAEGEAEKEEVFVRGGFPTSRRRVKQ